MVGGIKDNMDAAKKFAGESNGGKMTVELTKGGKFLNDKNLFTPGNWAEGPADAADIWNCASWLFASNAEGLIHTFGGNPQTKSAFKNTPNQVPTFWNIELPTIKANHEKKGNAEIGT